MDRKISWDFVEKIFEMIQREEVLNPENCAVVDFKHPAELKGGLLDLELNKSPINVDDFLNMVKRVFKYSVKTSHRHFYNQLYGGVDLYGFGGVLLSESLNTNQHTYEVSPVFTLIEQEVVKHFSGKVGFQTYDGIFCPGGSIGNMYGTVLARHAKFPGIKQKGIWGNPKLIIFTSEDGHYSTLKGANWLGFGTDNVRKIKTCENGRLCSKDLEKNILKCGVDEVPLLVIAMAGTTIFGAIDPIDDVADICRRYQIWLHVDACFGGTLLLSNKHKEKLRGIEKSDSIIWNSHKMLGAPLQCSLFLTKHVNLLMDCNSSSASYLFQPDKMYDVTYDTGDKSIQCGRKVDAFKLWTMWKLRGDLGFEMLVDNAVECAVYFQNQIRNREGFRLVNENVDTTSVCFFYIPISFRNKQEDETWKNALNIVTSSIKNKLIASGDLMICYTPMASKNLCNFFRLTVTCHPARTFKDMDYIITQIENTGYDM